MNTKLEKHWNIIRLLFGTYMTVTMLAVWYCTFFKMCGRLSWLVSGLGYGHVYPAYFYFGSALELSALVILLAAGIALVWKGSSLDKIALYLQWSVTGLGMLLVTKVIMCLLAVFQTEMFYPEGIGYAFAAPLVLLMVIVLFILIPVLSARFRHDCEKSTNSAR